MVYPVLEAKALAPEKKGNALYGGFDLLKTSPEEIGHHEKRLAVAPEPRFELTSEGTESVAAEVVVGAEVKGRAGIRRPAQEKLATDT